MKTHENEAALASARDALWTGPLCLVVLLLLLRLLLSRDCGPKRRCRRCHCRRGTEAGASAGSSAESSRTPPRTPAPTPRTRVATPRVTGAHKDARRRRTSGCCSRDYGGGSCGSGRPLFVLFLACVAGASARPGPSDEARPLRGLSLCWPPHQERSGDPPLNPPMSAKDGHDGRCSGASATPLPSSLPPSSSIFYPLGEASRPAPRQVGGTPNTPRTNRMFDDWSRAPPLPGTPSPNGGGSRTRAPTSPFSSTSFGAVISHLRLGTVSNDGDGGCGGGTPREKGPGSSQAAGAPASSHSPPGGMVSRPRLGCASSDARPHTTFKCAEATCEMRFKADPEFKSAKRGTSRGVLLASVLGGGGGLA